MAAMPPPQDEMERRLEELAVDIDQIDLLSDDPYVCQNNSIDYDCPYTCNSLAECESCECAVQDDGVGPWGKAMDVIFCLVPIIFLVVATVPPCGLKALPTTKSLPLSALLMAAVRLLYLGSDPLLVAGSVVKGVHEAITPLTIMAGAICLFETMEATNCMPYMMREMKALTNGHAVAELCVIFCFAYMVEGASGFGTPVALGAPMLISLGHPKLESVVVLLLANTFATVFGAAGTPIWFGFGSLGLTDQDFLQIGFNAAVGLALGAYLLVPFVFTIIVPFQRIKENLLFVFLALSGCMLPMLGISFVSYEFPSLIGGMIGLGLAALLIHFKVGMKAVDLKVCEESGRHPLDIATISERSVVATVSAPYISRSDLPTLSVGKSDGTSNVRVNPNTGEIVHMKRDEDETAWAESSEFVCPEDEESKHHPQANGAKKEVAFSDEDANHNTNDDTNGDANGAAPRDDHNGSSINNIYGHDDLITDSQRAVEDAIGPRKSGLPYVKEFLLRTSPITLTVLLLIITRIPQIGLNSLLKKTEPNFTIYFGTYATFRVSAALVFQLENILTYPNLNWKYETLYTPFVLPFVLVSVITYGVYRKEASDSLADIFKTVYSRVKNPAIALAGALTLVQLMINGEQAAPASIIGIVLSEAFKGGWIAIAASIGALGSFFSGSTTVSNLTFGSVQEIAAETIGVNVNAMLALQAVGASAGNGICLNNIISACTVTGLVIGEGKIIAKTAKFVLAFIVVATLIMLAFLFGEN